MIPLIKWPRWTKYTWRRGQKQKCYSITLHNVARSQQTRARTRMLGECRSALLKQSVECCLLFCQYCGIDKTTHDGWSPPAEANFGDTCARCPTFHKENCVMWNIIGRKRIPPRAQLSWPLDLINCLFKIYFLWIAQGYSKIKFDNNILSFRSITVAEILYQILFFVSFFRRFAWLFNDCTMIGCTWCQLEHHRRNQHRHLQSFIFSLHKIREFPKLPGPFGFGLVCDESPFGLGCG